MGVQIKKQAGSGEVDSEKIICQCATGCCILEMDARWSKQNYVQALQSDGILLDHRLLVALEDERLKQKGEWMHALGVKGTRQICCREGTK